MVLVIKYESCLEIESLKLQVGRVAQNEKYAFKLKIDHCNFLKKYLKSLLLSYN